MTSNMTARDSCTAVGEGRKCHLVWVEKQNLKGKVRFRQEGISRSHNIEITDPENSTEVALYSESMFWNNQPSGGSSHLTWVCL